MATKSRIQRQDVFGFALAGAALFLLAVRPSPDDVHAQLRVALDTTGHRWVEVGGTGRSVQLRGSPPSAAVAASATEIVREATCRTALGSVRCARVVEESFEGVGNGWPDVTVTASRGTLTLDGVLPDEATHDVVRSVGHKAIKSQRVWRVLDSLTLAGEPAAVGVDATVGQLVEMAMLCEEGVVSMRSGVISVRCDPGSDARADLLALTAQRPRAGAMGDVALTEPTARAPEVDR